MLLAAASLVPGLGSLAAAMDMALYLYEGDNVNAALAAAALIPGGAILAVGAGKGIKALVTMARAGAPGLRAAIGCSRVVQGLGRAGGAVSRVVRSVRTRISRLIGKTDDVGRDVGKVGRVDEAARARPPLSAEAYEGRQLKLWADEPYNRTAHYGNTPTAAQRRFAGPGMEFDHDPWLVRHYYEGANGSIAGFNMTRAERLAYAQSLTVGRAATPAVQRAQGAVARQYSQMVRKLYGSLF